MSGWRPDDDFEEPRSWEEFLREVRREASGTGDDEAESAATADAGEREEAREADSGSGEEPGEPSTEDRTSSKEGRASGRTADATPPGNARVVVPPETESEGTHRRRRRMLIGGALAVLLLVGAFLVYGQIEDGGEGGRAGSGAPAERVEPPVPESDAEPVAGADRSAAAPAETARISTGVGERTAAFAARADTLGEAIAGFRERRRDFELGRIGCEGLARGVRDVRSAVTGLRAVAGEEGAGLAPPARERYRRLLGDVRSVEEAFSESGCTGPS